MEYNNPNESLLYFLVSHACQLKTLPLSNVCSIAFVELDFVLPLEIHSLEDPRHKTAQASQQPRSKVLVPRSAQPFLSSVGTARDERSVRYSGRDRRHRAPGEHIHKQKEKKTKKLKKKIIKYSRCSFLNTKPL